MTVTVADAAIQTSNRARTTDDARVEFPALDAVDVGGFGRAAIETVDSGPERDPMALLRRVPIFTALQEEDLARLATQLRRRTFRRGEVIFHRGDPAGALHVISSGLVKVSRPSEDGNETVLALLGAGACFGELAALDGDLRSATITAVESTETKMLLREDVIALARTSADLAMALVQVLAERLRRTDDWLDHAYFADLDTRLAHRLLDLAETHGLETAEGITVRFPLTQSDLAGMLGATRARVNRMLGIYQDEGLLRLGTGSFTILDREALEERAAS
jgi:CRP-like cAMP-binding protein